MKMLSSKVVLFAAVLSIPPFLALAEDGPAAPESETTAGAVGGPGWKDLPKKERVAREWRSLPRGERVAREKRGLRPHILDEKPTN